MSEDAQEKPLIGIDEHNLDKECIRLPGTFLKYAYATAEARKDLDEAKAALELVEADMAKQIRATPGQFNLEKVTEGAIREVILTTKGYQKAVARLHTAKHNLDNLQAVTSALEMKKRSLTLLVDLHGMGYYSAPRVSKQGKESLEEMTKRKVRRRDED